MDYYEELGIDPSASEDQIHRAHRRLTKLLHPDQQTDESVKALAETQMRRVNAIVEILSDPERRREYDSLLNREIPRANPLASKPGPTKAPWRERIAWQSLPWWVGSIIGAVVLTIGAVWFWADNWGSSFGNRTPAYVPAQMQDTSGTNENRGTGGLRPAPARKPTSAFARLRDAIVPSPSSPTKPAEHAGTEVAAGRPPNRATAAVRQADAPARVKPGAPIIIDVPSAEPYRAAEGNSAAASNSDRTKTESAMPSNSLARIAPSRIDIPPAPKLPANTPAQTEPPPIPLAALPPAAKPSEAVAPPPANVPATAPKLNDAALPAKASRPTTPAMAPKPLYQNPLEGEWVYAPSHPEKHKPGFYPPEFIDLKLFWHDGGLHGQYRARYEVTDRPISPEVSFTLFPAAKDSRKLLWQSNNGSRGTLKVSAIDASSIRIEWRTTVFAAGPALTAGTATLVRRTP
ncbi:MAG: DnaJ domain-containing protein [Bryobacteraceae bacterium]